MTLKQFISNWDCQNKAMLSATLLNFTALNPVFSTCSQEEYRKFPPHFMFQLNDMEFKNLKSQIVISNRRRYGFDCSS